MPAYRHDLDSVFTDTVNDYGEPLDLRDDFGLCEACNGPLDLGGLVSNPVCLPCVRARHRAAMDHRCHCGRARRPSEVHRAHSRTWVSCLRCLGTIAQLT